MARVRSVLLVDFDNIYGATGEDVAIPFSNIVISLFLIVVPASIGERKRSF